jgi:predicted RNA-binding protein with PUA-like domain
MKSEPDVFSFDDLLAAKGKRTAWDGVRNYQARNFMRAMKKADRVLFYHSNAKPPGVAGVCEVVREAYPDRTQFDPKDAHFDPASDPAQPRWSMVDVRALGALAKFVSLDQLKGDARLADMGVVRRGSRLSVQPVTAAEWRVVMTLGGVTGRF